MGMVTEGQLLTQAKKAQGETNERLDRIVTLLEEQNRILANIVTPQQSAGRNA